MGKSNALKNRLISSSHFGIVVVTLVFSVVVVPAAQAYLDPGTGSFILQTLIAALFGALFVLKSYWVRIKSWFSGSGNITADSSGKTSDKRPVSNDSKVTRIPDGADSSVVVSEDKQKSALKSDE